MTTEQAKQEAPARRRFLVIGLWPDDGGRWADSFEADSPEEAEALALAATAPSGEGCEHCGGNISAHPAPESQQHTGEPYLACDDCGVAHDPGDAESDLQIAGVIELCAGEMRVVG